MGWHMRSAALQAEQAPWRTWVRTKGRGGHRGVAAAPGWASVRRSDRTSHHASRRSAPPLWQDQAVRWGCAQCARTAPWDRCRRRRCRCRCRQCRRRPASAASLAETAAAALPAHTVCTEERLRVWQIHSAARTGSGPSTLPHLACFSAHDSRSCCGERRREFIKQHTRQKKRREQDSADLPAPSRSRAETHGHNGACECKIVLAGHQALSSCGHLRTARGGGRLWAPAGSSHLRLSATQAGHPAGMLPLTHSMYEIHSKMTSL